MVVVAIERCASAGVSGVAAGSREDLIEGV
jgi:hypothetical protein